ncbi:MAG: hypothetical protein NT075_35510 [Chloroflexi bacterium]|nr:hypothetical protein [Chloroflexota bacterium]
MKTIRENLPYLLLVLIAIILVVITISLQTTIISNQQADGATGSANNRGLLYTLRERIGMAILPATLTPPPASPTASPEPATPVIAVVATLPPAATDTPVPPTEVPPTPVPPTITPTPVPPTEVPPTPTPVPPTIAPTPVPPTEIAPTATSPAPAPPTAVVPTPVPPTPTTIATPTNTPGPRADLRLGYLDRDDCKLVTEIIQVILEQNFKLKIDAVAFTQEDELFATLAAKEDQARVDLTFCYIDPSDRSYLQKYYGYVIFVGDFYEQIETKRFQILSNSAVKPPLERDLPCVYKFIKSFKFEHAELEGQTASAWLEKHPELVQSWTTCQ